jgi:hypothetical protein
MIQDPIQVFLIFPTLIAKVYNELLLLVLVQTRPIVIVAAGEVGNGCCGLPRMSHIPFLTVPCYLGVFSTDSTAKVYSGDVFVGGGQFFGEREEVSDVEEGHKASSLLLNTPRPPRLVLTISNPNPEIRIMKYELMLCLQFPAWSQPPLQPTDLEMDQGLRETAEFQHHNLT